MPRVQRGLLPGGDHMHPIDGFFAALERSNHLLSLYHILKDNSRRNVRGDWAKKFNRFVRWPASDRIVKIVGKDNKSLLFLREDLGLTREHFSNSYLSELLRAALVSSVSALDRYLHDLIIEKCWKLLSRAEDDIPSDLKNLSVPALITKKVITSLNENPKAKPGNLAKKAIQESLFEISFQKRGQIERAASKFLGIKNIWTKAYDKLITYKQSGWTKQDVLKYLDEILTRRNQIVHEADLIRNVRMRRFTRREIKVSWVEEYVKFIEYLTIAIDDIVKEEI
jgi:hypothetical protein